MKTNLRSQRVSSFSGCLALVALALASGGVGLGGCAGGGRSSEDLGQARLAIGNVPNNVHCVRVTAQGVSRTVVRSVDVMPGQTVQTTLSGLPTGQVVFTAQAFSTACAAVVASSVPTWVSDPVTVTVATTPIVNVSLTLHPNGQATVGVGFQGDPTCFPTGSMCTTDLQCCNGQLCTSGLCSTPVTCMVPAPVAGDCQTQTCDASGNVVSTPDDTDLPADDGNPCTIEECVAGSPAHAFAPVGVPCNQNGGSVCNGSGACSQCVVSAQCPGVDSDCQVRACNNNTCQILFTAAGTPSGAQMVGDCRQNQCDGQGATVTVPDDTDVPPAGNSPCTRETCANGSPVSQPVATGTSCGAGLVCNGTGQCVGCVTVADCPGVDTECRVRTCQLGSCGSLMAPLGIPTNAQIPGDCRQNQCDGSGGIISAIDSTDVPVDGNACTLDVCVGGVPANPIAPVGSACNQNGGTVCNNAGLCI